MPDDANVVIPLTHSQERSNRGFEALKVGEMAQRTGLAVRTLHHDEVIGRLRPFLHTQAGYRLYTAADAARTTSDLSAGCCRGGSEGGS